MRDGNQSLVIPMSLEEKLEYYKVLLEVGFKEIEVGFPAASETEYEFLRTLIDNNMIPDDVTVQVLTQCREHIIRKTFDACKGAPSAIIHFYNSVSVAQREQVFKRSKEEIKKIAVDGAKLVKKLASEYEGNFRFEYSPESFTGTEPEYALEVCNAVLDVLQPSADNNVIINLPVTVEMSLPHIYASQVEFMSENLKYREFVTISLHPHNDRGTAVADAELGLLAGADRVEGTLFGNGERTGNVDIITLAMNMYSHGVDPKLDFSNMNYLVEKYEDCTRMRVHERAPYVGALVFAAFSGSHQDAIAKGMKYRTKNKLHEWSVPYIPIDPKDIGRTYDADVIRVNSQSGKGGIGYLLEQTYGYNLPAKMREHFSYMCKDISDREHKELKPDDVLSIFTENYLNLDSGISVTDFDFMRENEVVKINITFMQNGEETEHEAEGNGALNAVNNALREFTGENYTLEVFTQHSMQGDGSRSVAASYIGIEREDGAMFWGAGTDTDVIAASTKALLSAYSNMIKGGK
jgi:2-isopropylmalate synthase